MLKAIAGRAEFAVNSRRQVRERPVLKVGDDLLDDGGTTRQRHRFSRWTALTRTRAAPAKPGHGIEVILDSCGNREDAVAAWVHRSFQTMIPFGALL